MSIFTDSGVLITTSDDTSDELAVAMLRLSDSADVVGLLSTYLALQAGVLFAQVLMSSGL